MPRDGNGTYIPPNGSWTTNVGNGVDATTADWLALLNDISLALAQSLSKDGQTALTGNLSAGGNRITNLSNPVNVSDAVNLAYLTLATVAKALALESSVKIGGVDFDGSADINLPGVNEPGNQDTTGTAANSLQLGGVGIAGFVRSNGSTTIEGSLRIEDNTTPSHGRVYLGSDGNKYIEFNGTYYNIPNAVLYSQGYPVKLSGQSRGGLGTNLLVATSSSSTYTIGNDYALSGFSGLWKCLSFFFNGSISSYEYIWLFERTS